MSRPPKNMAISVGDRPTARAHERRENAQLLMTRYVIERLRSRLSLKMSNRSGLLAPELGAVVVEPTRVGIGCRLERFRNSGPVAA